MNRPPLARISFLGGFLPRLCGIATFTHDLFEAVAGAAPGSECFVCAVNDRKQGYAYPPRVWFELDQQDLASYRHTAYSPRPQGAAGRTSRSQPPLPVGLASGCYGGGRG